MPPTPIGPATAEPATAPDPAATAALLAAAEEADGYPSLSDRARYLLEARRDHTAVLCTSRDPATGALAGIAVLDRSEGTWSLETVVGPVHRSERHFAHLLTAALDAAASRGGGRIGAWHRGADDGGLEALDRAGLRPERTLLQLRAPLDSSNRSLARTSAPRVEVRAFRPGVDDAAWLEANRRAFAGHPDQADWSADDFEHRKQEPWFDPGGFLLHTVGDRIAAFCWTKVHRHPPLGEIYVIGVDPDHRGRKLGLALAVAGLGHLAAQGIAVAMLYVEATNEPALALYRSLGFREHHRETRYAGTVTRQAVAPRRRPTP